MPMKPKTKVMASVTMLSITVGFAALFIYIEEKKFEAMGYQQQLQALQQQQMQQGYERLMRALVKVNPDLASLARSRALQHIDETQAEDIVSALKQISAAQGQAVLQSRFKLNAEEIQALQNLAQQPHD